MAHRNKGTSSRWCSSHLTSRICTYLHQTKVQIWAQVVLMPINPFQLLAMSNNTSTSSTTRKVSNKSSIWTHSSKCRSTLYRSSSPNSHFSQTIKIRLRISSKWSKAQPISSSSRVPSNQWTQITINCRQGTNSIRNLLGKVALALILSAAKWQTSRLTKEPCTKTAVPIWWATMTSSTSNWSANRTNSRSSHRMATMEATTIYSSQARAKMIMLV